MRLVNAARSVNPARRFDCHDLGRDDVTRNLGFERTKLVPLRDSAGQEMEQIQKFMVDRALKRRPVIDYVRRRCEIEDIAPDETAALLRSLPNGSEQLRAWAKAMFNALLLTGVHAHAVWPRSAMEAAAMEQKQ